MESTISVLELRRRLGEVLERVSEGKERLMVSKRGRIQAVIMSSEEYFARIVPKDEALDLLQRDAKDKGLDRITDAEIQAEIQAVREDLEDYR